MTYQINPEFDRQRRAVCLFWLQGCNHKETPTDKNSICLSPGGVPLGYSVLKGGNESTIVVQIHLEIVDALSSFPGLLSLIGMNKQRLSTKIRLASRDCWNVPRVIDLIRSLILSQICTDLLPLSLLRITYIFWHLTSIIKCK